MTDIFNKRPKHRFTFVWDIYKKISNHLNKLLPVNLLSHKLALLLALTAATKSLEICYLNTEYIIVKLDDKYILLLMNYQKVGGKGDLHSL